MKQYQVRYLKITAEQQDQRLDNFLKKICKNLPISRIYKIIRKGEVRVNKKRISVHYKLQINDDLRLPPMELQQTNQSTIPKWAYNLKNNISFEDENLFIIDKPIGIAVHGGSNSPWGLIEALRAVDPSTENWELAHRLDRDTSGLLIIAKRRSILKKMHEIIKNQQITKTYIAVLKNKMTKNQNVNASLKKNINQAGERIVKISADGKFAKTIFAPIKNNNNLTLCKVQILTGRTHQIRVHGKHINHPVLGDEKYGDFEFNKQFKINRMFLHAYELKFKLNDKLIQVKAQIPTEFAELF